MTRLTPVSSRLVMSMQSARLTNGQGRRSVCVMLATSVWMDCRVKVSVSCRLTFASMMASVTSSPAKEPSAGE